MNVLIKQTFYKIKNVISNNLISFVFAYLIFNYYFVDQLFIFMFIVLAIFQYLVVVVIVKLVYFGIYL